LKHWANLQRALDGKSAFYVPDPEQVEKIKHEQLRLESARLGIETMARIWKLTPKPGREVPKRKRSILVNHAIDDSASALQGSKQASGMYRGFTAAEVAGLEELFHYLDAKVCLMEKIGQPCLEYRSLTEEIGYITAESSAIVEK
jgi:hypothetical protein